MPIVSGILGQWFPPSGGTGKTDSDDIYRKDVTQTNV